MTPTETFRKLLSEKCKPTTDQERVYASIMLAISERNDKLAVQVIEMTKAVKFLAKVLGEMKSGEKVETEVAEEAAQPAQAEPEQPHDQTPFPAGFQASGAPAANQPPPVAPTTTAPSFAEGIPQPNVGSSPAMNAQPIPKKQVAKNGSKEAQS